MINKKIALLAVTLAASFGAAAQTTPATGGIYGEVGYTSLKVKFSDDDGQKYSASPSAIRLIVGTALHPNFAVEGMLAFGAGKDTLSGTTEKVKLNNAFGIYVKPKMNLTAELELFGRFGYARSKVSVGGEKDSEGDVSYGLGLGYALSKQTSINVDYMSYYKKDGVKVDGFTFGVGYKF
jgi:opacity protein-like surface antigen